MRPDGTLTPTDPGSLGGGASHQQQHLCDGDGYQQSSLFFYFVLCDWCLLKTKEAKVPEASEANCVRRKRAGGLSAIDAGGHTSSSPTSQVLVVLSACVEASRLLSKV